MLLTHMHHVRGDSSSFLEDIATFLSRKHAVCATPVASSFRYACNWRIGLVIEAEPVRCDGKPLAWSGTSWLDPQHVTALEVDSDAIAGLYAPNELEFASLDGWRDWLERVAFPSEVWVIPATARLVGIEVVTLASPETVELARKVAESLGLELRVIEMEATDIV